MPEEPQISEQATNGAVSNGGSSGATANGNGHVKNQSDLAIYERYRNQVLHLILSCDGLVIWCCHHYLDFVGSA